ncbi:hypothetical protein MAPG_01369 [Magnaporthiopsis poae ATCC 64411]|uniref:Uncharacterized protein n=1 Tax=Magnaporthiopsis poae (strain ATCC 64411 / 73-15) TaxID=644358 RepID=A0A0C4DNI2_MAGP6|nr:hypothetical protein MAPG_01369 [Magnaporthiopsis poae ATCC 64411]
MGTSGVLSSGVNWRPRASVSAMNSLCVIMVPHSRAYRSVRQDGVPPRKSAGVVAEGLKLSILPQSLLKSASVMSLVQHLAVAALPLAGSAGSKGCVHLALSSGMATMLVVVCRSQCECRQTSSSSEVKATSHSWIPAPIREPFALDRKDQNIISIVLRRGTTKRRESHSPARIDSRVSSGICSVPPPRWAMESLVGFICISLHDSSLLFSGLSSMLSTSQYGLGPSCTNWTGWTWGPFGLAGAALPEPLRASRPATAN